MFFSRFIAFVVVVLAALQSANATTVFGGAEPDPFSEGAECDAPQIGSWGGYVYQWPSKFDFVFEPYIDLVWTCPASGYVSYPEHFNKLSDRDRRRIGDFLVANRFDLNGEGDAERLHAIFDQLEALVHLRTYTREDYAYLMRARAWLYRGAPKADEYRKRALVVHEEILESRDLQGWEYMVNHYIIGFYSWKLGDKVKGEAHFSKALEHEWISEEGEVETGNPYIAELIGEIKEGKAEDGVRFAHD